MDLYAELKIAYDKGRPLLCYGMGDGADKLFSVLAARGMEICDTFASDGFVRGQLFHGKRVLSLREALERYPDPIILVAFGSGRPEVLEQIEALAARYTLRIPDLPVSADRNGGMTVFDEDYYTAHKAQLDDVRRLLSDEPSKALLDSLLTYRLTGKPSPLLQNCYTGTDAFSERFQDRRYHTVMDLGAYTGDTAKELLTLCPTIKRLIAVEPDPRSYRKLAAYAATEPRVIPVHAAAWDREQTLHFAAKGNRNSAANTAGSGATLLEIPGKSPDAIAAECHAERVDYIKYDLEGAEEEALRGSAGLLRDCRPDLRIALYHRAEDLWKLPLLTATLLPDARYFLRRKRCFPGWDLDLFVRGSSGERSN